MTQAEQTVYEPLMREEVARLTQFLNQQTPSDLVGATAQDGGLPVSHALEHLNGSAWENFEEEFLARH